MRLPRSVLTEAMHRYNLMATQPWIRVARTRGQVRLPFDQSEDSCTAVVRATQGTSLSTGGRLRELRGGDRIKVKGTLATVVGVNRGKLWVRRDGVGE